MKHFFWSGLAVALTAATNLAGAAEVTEAIPPPRSIPAHWSLTWTTNQARPLPLSVEALALTSQARRQLRLLSRSEDSPALSSLLTVYVQPSPLPITIDLPALAGSHELKPGRILFKPAFPLQEGVSYRAEFKTRLLPGDFPPTDSPALISHFHHPAPPKVATTIVKQIYPSSDQLPENLLKFYLHFSASMSRGFIYDHIRLLNSMGRPVELPFLEIDQELWNRDLTRLTLLIDPGRIKRGVKPLEDIGPALESGQSFTLVIDSDWKDAKGAPLQSEFRKRFHVIDPDRTSPAPDQWIVKPPQTGTTNALEIQFGESMDHALARRLIRIQSPGGKILPGQISLHDRESIWRFHPDSPWSVGAYRIIADTILEDLAGNSIGRPFEVDVFEKVERTTKPRTVSLPFTVSAL